LSYVGESHSKYNLGTNSPPDSCLIYNGKANIARGLAVLSADTDRLTIREKLLDELEAPLKAVIEKGPCPDVEEAIFAKKPLAS